MTNKVVRKKIVVTIIGVLLALVVTTFLFGPFSLRHETCLFCGMSKETRKHCGITLWRKEKNTPMSEWIISLYPDHKDHVYSYASSTGSYEWFGYVGTGDRFLSLGPLWLLHKSGHEEEAREWLAKWHEALKLPMNEWDDALLDIDNALRPIVEEAFQDR